MLCVCTHTIYIVPAVPYLEFVESFPAAVVVAGAAVGEAEQAARQLLMTHIHHMAKRAHRSDVTYVQWQKGKHVPFVVT